MGSYFKGQMPLFRQCVASQACHHLPGGFTRPHCICKDARTGVLGACGASAHVHGQPRSRQFRGLGFRGLGFRVQGLRV